MIGTVDENSDGAEGGDVHDALDQKVSRNATVVEECTTYLNIATFLSSLLIPMDMTKCFPHLHTFYEGLPTEYFHRIPFWELLKQPWEILEPLLNDSAELSSKLTPICAYLNLERDEYYVKRARNLYSASMLGLAGLLPESMGSEYGKVLAVVADVVSYIKSPVEQVRVWTWIFGVEKDRYSEIALRPLEFALSVFDTSIASEFVDDIDKSIAMEELKKSVMQDVIKHKCRSELLLLDKEQQRLLPSAFSLVQRFGDSLGDLNIFLKLLLDYTIETAWVLQLRYMRHTYSVLCSHDLVNTPHLPVVMDFVRRMATTVHVICKNHSAMGEGSKPLPGGTAPMSILHTVRHAMIGRLLTDADIQKDSGDRVMLSTSDKIGFSGPSGWGVVDSGVSPSLAECRRRQDVFKAFAISVLVASCTDECPR